MGIERLQDSSVSSAEHRLEIERIVQQVAERSNPLSVYLFGSSLPGQHRHAGSDIDLAIVVESEDKVKPCLKAVYAGPPITLGKLDLLFFDRASFVEKARTGGVCQIIWEEGQLVFGQELRS